MPAIAKMVLGDRRAFLPFVFVIFVGLIGLPVAVRLHANTNAGADTAANADADANAHPNVDADAEAEADANANAGANEGSDNSDDSALLAQANQIFGPPLPQVISSETNPITPEKVKLGKMLFYETRVSIDGTVSCARCHPFGLYAADGLKKSIGNQCRLNPRNAPTVLNAAGQISAHWIGNRRDVEDQATQALVGPASFGMISYQAAESILVAIKGYPPLFREAFPGDRDPLRSENFGRAVGAFERTLVTPSSFDDFLRGKERALTEDQTLGLRTFIEVGCMTCHSGTYVGGQMYQKFGVFEPYWTYTKSETIDEGRYAVTKQESDRYLFKVPALRNVERTAPYFHDGSVSGLEHAVWMMGKLQLGKDLTQQQNKNIVRFLSSLTGVIPEDALKIPSLPPSD